MANTYQLIASNTLGSNTASVTFSSIPGTYTDLVLQLSGRSAYGTTGIIPYAVRLNNDTGANWSTTHIYTNFNGTLGSERLTSNQIRPVIEPDGFTANTFGSAEIYIPQYTASINKPISAVGFAENNSASASATLGATLWRNTAAVTSIVIVDANGYNLLAGSSFYLYGIKNS